VRTDPLSEAASRRHELTRARAIQALHELDRAGAPVGQRATDASLRARLTATLDRNKQLADENARLRRQLARALGDQRSEQMRSGNDQGG
jgi:hypothetical protein